MAVIFDPNNPITILRYTLGDTGDITFLDDSVYQWALDTYGDNGAITAKVVLTLAYMILAQLAPRSAREKAGKIEVYGGEYFTNYATFISGIITNPATALTRALGYAGGISRSDVNARNNDPDNIRPSVPLSRKGKPGWVLNSFEYDFPSYDNDIGIPTVIGGTILEDY